MKNLKVKGVIILTTAIFVGIFVTSCSNEVNHDGTTLKENPEYRNEVFNYIITDRELLNDFMDQMMNETQSMHWMMENQQFMNHMFSESNMDYMIDHNSGMGRQMMNHMKNIMDEDSSLYDEWEMMHNEQGHMH